MGNFSAADWPQSAPQPSGESGSLYRWAGRQQKVTNRCEHKKVLYLNVISQSDHQTYNTEEKQESSENTSAKVHLDA